MIFTLEGKFLACYAGPGRRPSRRNGVIPKEVPSHISSIRSGYLAGRARTRNSRIHSPIRQRVPGPLVRSYPSRIPSRGGQEGGISLAQTMQYAAYAFVEVLLARQAERESSRVVNYVLGTV